LGHKSLLFWKLLAFLLVFATAGYLRFESALQTQVISPLRADALQYFSYAWNLKYNRVYSLQTPNLKNMDSTDAAIIPDAVRTPGYPLFLSIFLKRQPDIQMILTIILVQALISTATVGLVFLIGICFLPFPWALTAMILTAISPHLIVANSYILTETLFCFFLLVFLFGFVWMEKNKSFLASLISGAILGITTLVRPSMEFFLIVAILALIIRSGWKNASRLAVGLTLGFALTFGPWVIRNINLPASNGKNRLMINFLHHGMYPGFKYRGENKTYGFPYRFDPRSKEISSSLKSVLVEIAKRFREDTVRHMKWYFLGKPRTLWSWSIIQGQGGPFVYPVSKSPFLENNSFYHYSLLLMFYLHWVLVAIAGTGVIKVAIDFALRQPPDNHYSWVIWVVLILIYFTSIHMIGAPFPRYAVPLKPLVYLMAVFVISKFFQKVRASSTKIEV